MRIQKRKAFLAERLQHLASHRSLLPPPPSLRPASSERGAPRVSRKAINLRPRPPLTLGPALFQGARRGPDFLGKRGKSDRNLERLSFAETWWRACALELLSRGLGPQEGLRLRLGDGSRPANTMRLTGM
ncbi:hypothetical protein MTO96_009885 [Rhipicephalus appendiculatus]